MLSAARHRGAAGCRPRPQRQDWCCLIRSGRGRVGVAALASSSAAPLVQQPDGAQAQHVSRRRALLSAASIALAADATALDAHAAPLAPLGGIERVGGEKRTGLGAEGVRDVLARDIGVGQYFVSGNLTNEVFSDTCVFKDPTNEVTGLARYVKALGLLFDPTVSKVELVGIRVTGPSTVEADWRMGGWLRSEYFPWGAKVEPFEGHTVYTLGADGLIVRQDQTWSISALRALQQTFTPASGPRVVPF